MGIGAPLARVEDRRRVTGRGHFVDDRQLPGMAHAFVVRSPHPHARIVAIDKSVAVAMPGVHLILAGEDAAADGLRGLPCNAYPPQPQGSRHYRPSHPILATGKVRHVGDRVALVVADTLAQAKDAAERLTIDYEPLAAITLSDALAEGAAKVWDESHGNVAFALERGDRTMVERQFAAAAHVTRISLHYPRACANPMEPRAALAFRDGADGRLTLCTTTQTPYLVRSTVAEALGLNELELKVVAPDVGGGFGMKAAIYPEEALVVWAAGKLDRPVKWTGERSECIASDTHGRHQITHAELALDAHGKALALRVSVEIDLGAYLSNSAGVPPLNAVISYTSTYDVPLIHAVARAIFTNTCALGPYRGSGKPEASFVIERLIDKAAREMGIDVVAMRRRNFIPASAMPYKAPSGYVYDCGEFEHVLDKALALADWNGFGARRAESERRGARRGIGLAMHCQRAGSQSERMEIRVAPNGSVALHVGTVSTGQGHETVFAQMVAEWLGVPIAEVTTFQGDTDKILFGRGTFAQRSMIAGGSALKIAAQEVISKGKRLAAWMLEASEADIEFERAMFRIKGTDRQLSFSELARKSYQGTGLPAELGIGLDGTGSHPGPDTFPNGCMICEVEVAPDTGEVAVVRICAVDDTGTAINPLLLEGQLHGSIAQGLGEALTEEMIYERDTAQLLTGSFLDYAMPRASDLPAIVSALHPVATSTNLIGVKGGAEAGNAGAPAAIIHAIIDALSPWGVTDLPLPATPERVWRAVGNARAVARMSERPAYSAGRAPHAGRPVPDFASLIRATDYCRGTRGR
jgi:carbon-monoxide dehydrogenase large subunit